MTKGILPCEGIAPRHTHTHIELCCGSITFRGGYVANVAALLSARESGTGVPRLGEKLPPGLGE